MATVKREKMVDEDDGRDNDGGGGGEEEGIEDEVVVVPAASAPAETFILRSRKKRKAVTQVEEQPRNVKKVKTALPKGKKKGNGFIWTADEDAALVEAVDEYGLDFDRIKAEAGACLGDRKKKEEDEALKRGRRKHGSDYEKILETENEVLGDRTVSALQSRYYNKIK
ncbi:hypothetical protein TrLO_g13650 [Triparma laevis f. longispina]|uniref:Myb-like domain-containing protein n=1 Tax=Triparma laevis f. longispina TaxID=1714387 RepID=A0A9W6ZUV1_9STRA|nr:hypothetical protein TrLO_g13650 [Triparma laevis f. longispina]